MQALQIVFILILPLLVGYPVRKILDYTGKGIADTYVSGVLMLFIISGALQLPLLKLSRPFSDYEMVYPLLILFLSLIGLVMLVIDLQRKLRERERGLYEHIRGLVRSFLQDRESLLFCILTLAVILLCCVRIWMEPADTAGDFTLETIRTTLETDSIYQYNSLTGQRIEEGMPIRQQLLTLPFFLAFLSKWLSMDATLLVYRFFPCFVLLLSLLVYGRWGAFLFPRQRQKQSGFLFVISFMILAGDYARLAPAAILLHQGFTGNAVCVGVILPFTIYLCMKKKFFPACLCVASELFLIWTTYGFGYSMLVLVLFLLLFFAEKTAESRLKKEA